MKATNGIVPWVTKSISKSPILLRNFQWLMGYQLEETRNLMNINKEELQKSRMEAYNIQDTLQEKEKECRYISDSLRRINKTDPQYVEQTNAEHQLSLEIDSLQKNLKKHQEKESEIFINLQQSMLDYHQIDNEYRESLKRISYTWSIVWIVCSVGIGTVYWWRFRKQFFADLKMLNNKEVTIDKGNVNIKDHKSNDIDIDYIQDIMNNAINKHNEENNKNHDELVQYLKDNKNHEEVVKYLKELQDEHISSEKQLNSILRSLGSSDAHVPVNDNEDKYYWKWYLLYSMIGHAIVLFAYNSMNSSSAGNN